MPDAPIPSNPPVTPSPATPPTGEGPPRLDEGKEGQEPKPFSLAPEEGMTTPGEVTKGEQRSPMDLAGETAQQKPMNPEEIGGQINKLKGQLEDVQNDLRNPDITNEFSPDHYEAMNRLIEKANPDFRAVANNSETEFNPPAHQPGESVLSYVSNWLDGSQKTLSNSLDYLAKQKSPNIGGYMKLQYAVQRATQRGELFASIVGSSVSGIKTIMSTQLG